MRIVVALGGNALLRRGEPAEAERQRRNVARAATGLAAVAERHQLVVTHGNGPQVGLLALEADGYKAVPPYPLDVLGAESQGMIGYMLAQALQNALGRTVVCALTQVVVDEADAAFGHPTKPIGPIYTEGETRRLTAEHPWAFARDGAAFRRVVPSPEPVSIVEVDAIERLVETDTVVICCGGGGIPVVADDGRLRGVEAVIDKDLTAELLAEKLHADRLVMVTDVPFVERSWRTARAAPIEVTTPDELRRLRFAAGSMAPKVEAACRFVERTGGTATIGALEALAAAVQGLTGTQVVPHAGTGKPQAKPRVPGRRSSGRVGRSSPVGIRRPAMSALFHAIAGDVIIIEGRRVGDQRRVGEVVEVLGADADHPRYRVRWDDGHETVFYPSGDAQVKHVNGMHETERIDDDRHPAGAR